MYEYVKIKIISFTKIIKEQQSSSVNIRRMQLLQRGKVVRAVTLDLSAENEIGIIIIYDVIIKGNDQIN